MSDCPTCKLGRLVDTHMRRLTMPIQREMICNACSQVVWAIPNNWGESFTIVETLHKDAGK